VPPTKRFLSLIYDKGVNKVDLDCFEENASAARAVTDTVQLLIEGADCESAVAGWRKSRPYAY
jgi:hypothetical protein